MNDWLKRYEQEKELRLKTEAERDALKAAMQDILGAHANDTIRPKAFYIASAALDAAKEKAS